MVNYDEPIICNRNENQHIDYGAPIVGNKSTDYRTTTATFHSYIPEMPSNFDSRVKVNIREDLKYTDVALKNMESITKKDYTVKHPFDDETKFNIVPRCDRDFMRNVQEKMFADPPKPMAPKISEMKDNYRMNYLELHEREVYPPALTATCPVQGLGRDEQPAIRPENAGHWKWLDPYLTTNRATYLLFDQRQCKDARKDLPTFYNSLEKYRGFEGNLPPASGNKCIFDSLQFKEQLPNRLLPFTMKRVPNLGITSEYSANYQVQSKSDLTPYLQVPGDEFSEALSESSAWQNLAAPGMYCTEYCQIGTGQSSRNMINIDKPIKKEIVHKPCRVKFTDDYKY